MEHITRTGDQPPNAALLGPLSVSVNVTPGEAGEAHSGRHGRGGLSVAGSSAPFPPRGAGRRGLWCDSTPTAAALLIQPVQSIVADRRSKRQVVQHLF